MTTIRSRARGARILLALALLAGTLAALTGTASAVKDTGRFELDGNAVRTVSDDWDEVCYNALIENGATAATAQATCGTSMGSTANENAWSNDGALNASIFTGGGSKDPLPIEGWAWKDEAGGLPDKDNLLHAFAARYTLDPDTDATDNTLCPSGTAAKCDVLYFGSDRYDNSGDAHQAFWFLQGQVGLGSNKIGGGTGFTGSHTNGDVLVVSEFSNGGTKSTIKIWKWDTTCTRAGGGCADTNLRILAESTTANCGTSAPGAPYCGTVNGGTDPTDPPWSFTDKSGSGDYLQGEFFEAGINLSTLGLADQCFSTVVAESRSSTSSDATLKDFVIAPLGSCGATLTTTPADGAGTAIPGTPIRTIAMETDGTLLVRDTAALAINGTSTWSGTLQFFLCGPIAAPATCTTGGQSAGAAQAVSQATTQPILGPTVTVTEVGRYCWRGFFDSSTTGLADQEDSSLGECFTVTPVTPTLSTQAVNASNGSISSVALGSAIYDRATLSGAANKPGTGGGGTNGSINPITAGAGAGGSITFKLYGPGSSNCNTLAAGFPSDGLTVSVSGNDTYGGAGSTPAVSFTPTAAGDYYWKAVYSGDSPNTLGQSHNGDCSVANEKVTVNPLQPGITTAQRFVPNDAATVTVASGGGNLAGSVVFKLYVNDTTCAGTPAYTSSSISITDTTTSTGTGTSRTVMSLNTTEYTASSTFRWVAEYTSTNTNHQNVTSPCGKEISSLTINNNATIP